MRIVGGRFKGRSLTAPPGRSIRPTSDRLREALFNILAHAYGDPCVDARVIDLFAGTGTLGFEALSRGAAAVLFVDTGAEAEACLRASITALGVADLARVARRDAATLGLAAGDRYDLAFLDPPYGRGLAEPALQALGQRGWLAADALCVVEEAAEAVVALPAGFAMVEQRTYGATQIVIARFATRPT